MSQEIVTRAGQLPATADQTRWSDSEKAVVTAAGLVFTHGNGTTEAAPRPVVEQYLHMAQRTGLDPLARQLYCIGRFSRKRQAVEWAIQVSIDGFRVIAERHGQYGGQHPALWLTAEGTWVDVWVNELHGDHPLAAKVAVVRKDWTEPLVAVATWESYCPMYDGKPQGMWRTMGPTMIAKCAEALALRKAFPQDLSGLYTSDEMQQAAQAPQEGAPVQVEAQAYESPGDGRTASDAGTSEPIASTSEEQQAERDWLTEVRALNTTKEAQALFCEVRDAGLMDVRVKAPDGREATLRDLINAQGSFLREREAKAAAEAQQQEQPDANAS